MIPSLAWDAPISPSVAECILTNHQSPSLFQITQKPSRTLQRKESTDRLLSHIQSIEKFDKQLLKYTQIHSSLKTGKSTFRDRNGMKFRGRQIIPVPPNSKPKLDIRDSIQLSNWMDTDTMTKEETFSSIIDEMTKDTMTAFAAPFASHSSHKQQILNAIRMDDIKLLNNILKLCQLLCKRPAKKFVNEKDEFGCPFLITAAQYGRYEICKLLIEKGHKIHCKNVGLWTPVLTAAYYGNFETMKLLIESAKNDYDYSIYHAITLNDIESLKKDWKSIYLQQYNLKKFTDFIKMFWSKILINVVKKGEDLRLIDHILRYNQDHHEFCKFRFEDINDGTANKIKMKSDEIRNTVLHYAVKSNNTDIFNLMIRQIQTEDNMNKPWILEEYLSGIKNGIGLSVVGYAVYCKSDNILRVMVHKMKQTITFTEWTAIEYKWRDRNIENVMKKRFNTKHVDLDSKVLKILIEQMIVNKNIFTTADVDAEVIKEIHEKDLNLNTDRKMAKRRRKSTYGRLPKYDEFLALSYNESNTPKKPAKKRRQSMYVGQLSTEKGVGNKADMVNAFIDVQMRYKEYKEKL